MAKSILALLATLCAWLFVTGAAWAAWEPERYVEEDTLEFLTVGPEEGEHWSYVWLVVLDGEVYVRLGTKAAERMNANTRAPLTSVRITGEEFPEVETISTPDMAGRVQEAMADKYATDIFVRYMAHPLTMKLRPAAPSPAAP
jgi:hypothetical protein